MIVYFKVTKNISKSKETTKPWFSTDTSLDSPVLAEWVRVLSQIPHYQTYCWLYQFFTGHTLRLNLQRHYATTEFQ